VRIFLQTKNRIKNRLTNIAQLEILSKYFVLVFAIGIVQRHNGVFAMLKLSF
jgi:hypothetical protein